MQPLQVGIMSRISAELVDKNPEARPFGWMVIGRALFGPAVIGPMALWASNPGRVIDVPIVIAASMLVLLAAVGVTKFLGARDSRHISAAQLGTLLFWAWGAMPRDWLDNPWLEISAGVATILAAVWLGAQMRSFGWLPVVIGATFGAAALSMFVTSLLGARIPLDVVDPQFPDELVGASVLRDIVVLVVDGYTSPVVLDRDYGYDIAPTIAVLEDAGFDVPRTSYSNFTYTQTSLAAMLGLDYPVLDEDQVLDSKSTESAMRLIAGDVGLMAWMKTIGYDVTKLRSGWELDKCGEVDTCLGASGLSGMTSWVLVGGTPLRGLVDQYIGHPYPNRTLSVLEQLPILIADAAQNDRPDFIMAHVISPHGPYLLSSDCQINSTRRVATVVDVGYTSQVACVNEHLEILAQAISSTDINALIVGDHGSDEDRDELALSAEWSDRELTAMFSILVAVRTTDNCIDQPGSLVNLVRAFVGCSLDVYLPTIEDRHYATGPGPLIDVTDRLVRLAPYAGN